MPTFSIVVPCHNAEAHLDATVQSVVDQDFADWELILIDDGSTDRTGLFQQRWARNDRRIQARAMPCNSGPSRVRNHGALDLANGEIIAFLDADDLWAPNRLSALAETFLAQRDTGALFTGVSFFDTDPRSPATRSTVPARNVTVDMLLAENPVCTMSNIAVRRSVFQATGGFHPGIVHGEDVEWLIRLVAGGCVLRGIDAPLMHYRTSLGGLSGDLAAMRRGWQTAAETAQTCNPDLSQATINRAEAVHLRYLARRALRVDAPNLAAARFALAGLRKSLPGFFNRPRRGLATLAGALAAPLLPQTLRKSLFR